MTVAKCLTGADSRSRMFPDDSALVKCVHCGYRLDFQAHNQNYRLQSQSHDIWATYDGQTIGSLAFKRFCESNNYSGIRFLEFDLDETHFHIIIDRVVAFDPISRQTRFENLCPVCGNYESVVGATPAFLAVDAPVEDGFYRTDLMFATGNEKGPAVIVGLETERKIRAAGLRGCNFHDAFGASIRRAD